MEIRPLRPSDYLTVISVIDNWWGGRQMADMLPRLFFDHFTDTCLAAERDGELAGFLVGFVSQSRPAEAYIHFVGIHPGERGHGLGRRLYERFFAEVRARNAGQSGRRGYEFRTASAGRRGCRPRTRFRWPPRSGPCWRPRQALPGSRSLSPPPGRAGRGDRSAVSTDRGAWRGSRECSPQATQRPDALRPGNWVRHTGAGSPAAGR